ncbi:hypothetical protein [Streptomyces cucumeris]|uniref:hypothetical protein n=1 Tax=Streptomyces cucumeris TaxID=2962890 RepID=UPI0020C92887|nr:hypothetical protein [Streptomyces sp. NEAU-Y11]MCP9209279.1 hypothetical protein [Streptomyces sp. NEAU-Y11]
MADRRMRFTLDGNDRLSRVLNQAGDSADRLGQRLLKLGAIGGAAPMGAAVLAGTGAMVAAFASAGAAAGAFGAAVKPQLADVTEASELYTKAQEAAAEGGQKAADAQKAYKDALAKMPPATRDTAKAFIGLKSDFGKWSDSLSSTTMPIFTKGLGVLRNMLPSLTPLVKTAAAGLGGFVDRIDQAVKGGAFDRLVQRLDGAAKTTFPAFLNSAKDIAVGIGGIVNAFLPASGKMSTSIEDLTEKFARWGQGLGQSEGFQKFLDMAGNGAGALGNLGAAAGNLLVALGPLLGTTATLANAFARVIAALPPETLQFLATSLIAIRLATMGWAAAQMVLNGALTANPVGAVVAGVVLLGAAFITAWKKSQRFREIVTEVFAGLGVPVLQFAKIALQGLQLVVGGILTFVSSVTGIGAKAFGWVPGVGKYFKKGAAAVEQFRKDTDASFDKAIGKVDGWKRSLDNMPKKVRLQGDISDLKDKISEARNKLDDKNLSKERKAKLGADIREWTKKLHDAQRRLDELDGKKATPKIGASPFDLFSAVKRSAAALNGIKGRKPTISAEPSGLFGAVKRSISSLNTVKGRRPALSADPSGVYAGVSRARSWIASVTGKTVPINVVTVGLGAARAAIAALGGPGFARGGLVRGYASGGPVQGFPGGGAVRGPGSGTSDSILAMVSNGEFVMRAKAVARYGVRFMQALNEGRLHLSGARAAATSSAAGSAASRTGDVRAAGVDMVRGLITGMASQAGALRAAAGRTAGAALLGVRAELEIASPSRKMQKLGRDAGAGMIKGLTGTRSQIASTAKRLAGDIWDAFSGRKDNRLVGQLNRTTKRLQSLASQRDALAKRIADARKFASETASTAKSSAQLSNLGIDEGQVTAGSIKAGLASKLAQIKQFTRYVDMLGKRGLHKTVLRQILNMGPEAGYAYASALAGADKGTLGTINSLQQRINTGSDNLGRLGADRLYDSGKNAGKGFLKGLEGQQKNIEKLMLKIAKGMQKSIRRALGIKSPSTVMAEIGRYSTEGLARGLLERVPVLESAMGSVAGTVSAVRPVVGKPAAAPSARGSARPSEVHIHVDVTGALDPHATARAIRKELLKFKRDLGGMNLGVSL